MDTMTIDEFVAKAKELRAAADAAESGFLEFLMWGEDKKIHASTGKTYTEFLTANRLCLPERYAKFKRIRHEHPVLSSKLGSEGVIAAGSLKDPLDQLDVLEEVAAFERTNGTSISRQSAQRIMRDAKMRVAGRTGRRREGFSELQQQNERLKKEVAALRAENTALKAQIKKIKSLKRKAA